MLNTVKGATLNFLKSKKFKVAVAAALVAFLNSLLGWNLSIETILGF